MSKILDGYDTLFHIAGITHSAQLVSLALSHGIKRFILVHTTGIYSKYKATGELYRNIEVAIRTNIANHGTFGLQPVHQKDLGIAHYQVMVNPEVTKNKDYILSGATPN